MAIENGVIILEGNIGAGKTTLAHKISAAIKRLGLKSQTHEEPASGTNPFLDDYYKDPKATAFKMQMFMLAKRFRTTMNAQCNAADDGGWHVLDRSYYGDICFANVQRKLGFFDENEFAVYLEHHRMMRTFLAMPSLAVFLKCGVARCQERICKRARACESGIEDSYLSALQSEIDDLERVLCRRCRTKAVDVSVDMNDAELDDLAERIAIDACMADAHDASFDYRGDWLVNRINDDLKGLAQRENMA